jgi:hypothetical protein
MDEWEGRCCCNCISFKPLNKHPWNKGEGKGRITEKMGNVCMMEGDDSYPLIYFDADHGMCEMHVYSPKKIVSYIDNTLSEIKNK